MSGRELETEAEAEAPAEEDAEEEGQGPLGSNSPLDLFATGMECFNSAPRRFFRVGDPPLGGSFFEA